MPHKLAYIDLLKKYFNTANILTGIEIGCYKGEFGAVLLSSCPNLTLTTIDPVPVWHKVFENNKQWIEQQRLRILPLTSDEAAKILTAKYDFIFIDGEHSYEQCKKDIVNYLPLLRAGGLMSGHNYHKASGSAHPGVHKAVDEIFGPAVMLHPDFTWYVKI